MSPSRPILKPDVIVLDIGMPLLNGLEAGRQIKQTMRDVKLVFLTMNEDSDLAAEAFRAGASAYLLKRSAASELMVAIREVMQGRPVHHPARHPRSCGSAAERRPAQCLLYLDATAAGGPAAARRRSLDEGSGCRPEPDGTDGRMKYERNVSGASLIGGLVVGERRVVVLLPAVDGGPAVERVRVVGRQFDGPRVVGEGRVEFAVIDVGGGAVVVRGGVVRAEFDGLGEVVDGVRVLPGGGEALPRWKYSSGSVGSRSMAPVNASTARAYSPRRE